MLIIYTKEQNTINQEVITRGHGLEIDGIAITADYEEIKITRG